jgi:hypothetical protein
MNFDPYNFICGVVVGLLLCYSVADLVFSTKDSSNEIDD